MGAIATRLGIRTTDGVLFPYTQLTERQHDMRPWNGPMEKEWLIDTREARARRLKWLEEGRGPAAPMVTDRKPFSIATADKEQLLEYVANEFGETLDARLPILILRRQAIALAQKQIEDMEAAAPAAPAAAEPVVAEASAEGAPAEDAVPTRARGLGRRAA